MWSFFFREDMPMSARVSKAVEEIAHKPRKMSGLFWFFWLQICLAVALLMASVLVPIRLLW